MKKICKEYYAIDALSDGHVIRKRKYRKEYTNFTAVWYDYNGAIVSSESEIARLEAAATEDNRVDEEWDDHAEFMESHNIITSVSGLPMDKHFIGVNWTPGGDQGRISMKYDKGLDGDAYTIYVTNIGDKASILYTPSRSEGEKDEPNARALGDAVINVGGTFVNVTPGGTEAIRATYRSGSWYWEVVSKPQSSQAIVSFSEADFLVFRYLWDSDAGTDLDTATELLNSNIPGVDNNAVGWNCPGNGNAVVASILKWGGDNTGSGQECVWMSIKELRENHKDTLPAVTDFMTYATWFASKGTGKASFNLIAYKGGEMSQDGYNFINTGGEEVYNKIHSFEVNSYKGMPDYKNNYTEVTKVSYNKASNTVSMAVGDTVIDNQGSMEELQNMFSNYLAKDNTEVFVPTDDYNPATKKYVDGYKGVLIETLDNSHVKAGSFSSVEKMMGGREVDQNYVSAIQIHDKARLGRLNTAHYSSYQGICTGVAYLSSLDDGRNSYILDFNYDTNRIWRYKIYDDDSYDFEDVRFNEVYKVSLYGKTELDSDFEELYNAVDGGIVIYEPNISSATCSSYSQDGNKINLSFPFFPDEYFVGIMGGRGYDSIIDYDITRVPGGKAKIVSKERIVMSQNNTKEFHPVGDYNPASKKYVDDSISTQIGNISTILDNINGEVI